MMNGYHNLQISVCALEVPCVVVINSLNWIVDWIAGNKIDNTSLLINRL